MRCHRRGPEMTSPRQLPALRSIAALAITGLAVSALAAFLVLTVATIRAIPVQAQETISLTGQVVNGTAGGEAPDGLTVLLLVLDGAGSLISTGEASTDQRGAFGIKDVPVAPGGSYLLDVEYEGTAYQKIIAVEQLQDDLQLTVYETAADISVIRLQRQVMVIIGIDSNAREITATDFVRFSNPTDRTIVSDLSAGAPMGFLRFTLPPGTTDLRVNSDLPSREIITIGTGFAVTSPITPGDHSIEFSYRFPYKGELVSYRQNLLQGAEVYQVMAPERLTQLQVRPLEPIDAVDIQGTQYKVWQGTNLAPREGFLLELANLPSPPLAARIKSYTGSTGFWTAAIPYLMGVSLACLLVFGILTRRILSSDPTPTENDLDPASRAELVSQLALLDQRFEAGNTPREEYQAQRQHLKDQILGPSDASQQGD